MQKRVKIYCGDVADIVKGLDKAAFDGCLSDPPYELGFLGQKWDSTGVAFKTHAWERILRVCKPGTASGVRQHTDLPSCRYGD